MFLLNSRLGLFTAAIFRWHPFSRSYGVILPSSLTMLLPSALGFSPHPPVSVYGTGAIQTIAAFLDSVKSTASGTFFPPHHSLALKCADLPTHKPHCLDTLYQRRALSILLCPHFTQTTFGGTGISTSCPSPTTLVLGLGPD